MTALIFALSVVGAYGVLFNLLAAWRRKENEERTTETHHRFSIYGLPILGPLFLLFVPNLEGFHQEAVPFGDHPWQLPTVLEGPGTHQSAGD